VDEKPVTPDDKRWARLQRSAKTMGTSAIGELIEVFTPSHRHVAEETRRQREGRAELAAPTGPDGRDPYSGSISLSVPPRGTQEAGRRSRKAAASEDRNNDGPGPGATA
jgi:hypothetical protein